MRVNRKSSEFIIAKAVVCGLVCFSMLSAQPQSGSAANQDTHGIVAANMDPAVKPGNDFYLYANGAWMKRTEIPPDRRGVGVFSTLDDLSNQRTRELIEDAAKAKAPAGSNNGKIAALYNSYLDEAAIEAKGIGPLGPHLKSIAGIHNQ